MIEALPLSGLRIAVTRPEEQANRLESGIEQLGGLCIRYPLLKVSPISDKQALKDIAARLHEFQLAIFISPNAVHFGMEVVQNAGGIPATLQVACIGHSSAKALHALGIKNVLVPAQGADSEALLALPELHQVAGKNIVIFRGDKGRELLGDTLKERGASVQYAACYLRSNPQHDIHALLDAKPDVLSLSSSEALRNLWELLDAQDKERIKTLPIFVSHERIAAAARSLGCQNVTISAGGDDALLSALASWADQKRGGKIMTDNNKETDKAASTSAPPSENETPTVLGIPRLNFTQIALLVVIFIFAWQWIDSKQQLKQVRQTLAQRLSDADNSNKAMNQLTQQSQELVRELGGKLSLQESKYAETEGQRTALETLYQELASNRDQIMLAEVEQLLLIAGQQLQLASNVKAALIALQQAQRRLQHQDRPALKNIRLIINNDIDKLRALPEVDVYLLNTRLNNLIAMVDNLKLVQEIRATQDITETTTPAADKSWKSLLGEIWMETLKLVRIENTHKNELPLLSPTQTFFLRENLKLRLLSARISLSSRDEKSFKYDIKTAQDWVTLYFDIKSEEGAQAISTLQKLSTSNIKIELPDVSRSLEAVRNYRASHEKDAR